MVEIDEIYTNRCYRRGPCLHGTPIEVTKKDNYDYYDPKTGRYMYLECQLFQKHFSPSPRDVEERQKYLSGTSLPSFETPDLQLADTDGVWMTRSDDPDLYQWDGDSDTPETCSICELVCDIRDDERYLNEDDTCPFPPLETPRPEYWKITGYDQKCGDFLHPLLLDNIEAINRKRKRAAKAHIWKHLQEPKWMHTLINSGQRMVDVWRRNYQPATFYFRSFETVYLYLRNVPAETRSKQMLAKHIRRNLEFSPSFQQLLSGSNEDWERRMLEKIGHYAENGMWPQDGKRGVEKRTR